jgi:NAD(P)H-hydrate repair Nnr-like enzyme with NAD(P)H-hydrate epimerase domain
LTIGGQRRIQPNNHNAAPLIVVLAGNNNHVGSYGLTAARHLLNRGCQVIVFIAANANANISQRIVNQEYLVQLAGGQVVRCVEGIFPFCSSIFMSVQIAKSSCMQ